MRSWPSREDTFVSDEPFYAYYLKEQQIHPMHKEIIGIIQQNLIILLEIFLENTKPKNIGIKNIWRTSNRS